MAYLHASLDVSRAKEQSEEKGGTPRTRRFRVGRTQISIKFH